MNKALPWNVNGVGFDARNAAREAARRQGKSLGEWLHGVIADHAADLGVDEHEMGGQQRINAVTSKLERLSARSSEHDRRLRTGRGNEYARRRTPRDREEDFEERDIRAARSFQHAEASRRTDSAPAEATEFLLEEAIESMERRALRAERHADEALKSFTRLLERSEVERDRERNSVDVLAQKLSAIETRLTDRLAPPEEHPIKGALTRLEARLDQIGIRDVPPQTAAPKLPERAQQPIQQSEPLQSEVPTRPHEAPPVAPPVARAREPYRRLEEKLNLILAAPPIAENAENADAPMRKRPRAEAAPESRPLPASDHSHQRLEEKLNLILDAVNKRPVQPQDAAPVPSLPEPTPRGLGKAIADIVERQKALDGDRPVPSRHEARKSDAMPAASASQSDAAQVDAAPLAAMQSELTTLSRAVDGLRRDVTHQRKSRSQRAAELEQLVKEAMNGLLDITSRANPAELAKSADTLFAEVTAARKHGLKRESLAPVKSVATELKNALPRMNLAGTASELQIALVEIDLQIGRMANISVDPAVVAEAHDELRDARDVIVAKSLTMDRLRRQIVFLTECLDRQVRHPSGDQDLATEAEDLRSLLSEARDTAPVASLGERVAAISASIEQELGGSRHSRSGQEIAALQAAVRDLSDKFEAAQAPGAASDAFEALHQQVSLLSQRFERFDEDFNKLGSIERSVGDLFAHIEETRASVEVATETSAEVLRAAVEEGHFQADEAARQSYTTLRALQEESETRTISTLGAVHGTLEKVVDRLSAMEAEIAETRRRNQPRLPNAPTLVEPEVRLSAEPAASPKKPPEKSQTPATVIATEYRAPLRLRDDPDAVTTPVAGGLLVRILGHRPGEDTTRAEAPAPSQPPAANVKPEDEPSGADFIAAARRAAKLAQASLDETAKSKSPRKPRESLAAASRRYVARNQRSVLLATAAVLAIAGAVPLARLATDGETKLAERSVTTRLASATEPNGVSTEAPSQSKLAQSTLPISAQPAKVASEPDPVQTGSLPNLPSFAAGEAARPRQAPTGTLKTLAESGSPAAEYALGVQLAEGSSQDFAHAAEWYQKAADHNIAPAQYRLASLYEKGLGVTQDKAKARALYLKAAEAGNPRAMHNLAVLLADGDGKPDYESAANWFRKAAQFGIHDSQYNLAILLARGIGVKQSLVQSYQWFAIAADQGDADASKKRDEVGARLGPGDVAVAKALASSFHPHAADMAAVDVAPPPGGWDGAAKASPVNSAKPKISSL